MCKRMSLFSATGMVSLNGLYLSECLGVSCGS